MKAGAEPNIDVPLKSTGEVVSLTRRSLAAGQADKISLSLPEGMPFDEWAAVGEALANAERSLMWWIGDWWAYGEARYGERKQLLEDLRKAGYDVPAFQTAMDAAWVAKQFKTSRRREVSWSHHREVAKLDPEDADWLLDRAEEHGWSQKKLRDEVRELKNQRIQRPGEHQPRFQSVEDLQELVEAGETFGAIYADPPWPYDNQGTRASTSKHYKAEDASPHAGMSLEELMGMPVAKLAADNAHLHLWTTTSFLEEALQLIRAWGFTYKSQMVWTKPDFGLGNYWRVSHELLLLGTRGQAPFFEKNEASFIHEKPGTHSTKPEKVRKIIERVSPTPRLELFARSKIAGWTVWGNEIEQDQGESE